MSLAYSLQASASAASPLRAKRVAVFSDLETDDLLAIGMIVEQCRAMQQECELLLVTGESDPLKKEELGWDLCQCLMEDYPEMLRATCFAGDGSKKDYPFLKEGDVQQEATHRQFTGTTLSDFDPDEVYLMKPMRECGRLAAAGELRRLTRAPLIFCYASFNVRTLDPTGPETLFPLREWLGVHTPFRWLESFDCVGQRNSMNGKTDPEVFTALAASKLHWVDLTRRVMRRWNEHIIEDCRDTLRELLKPEVTTEMVSLGAFELHAEHLLDPAKIDKAKRNQKIMMSIEAGGVDTQFVIADILLPASRTQSWFEERYLLGFDPKAGYPLWGAVPDVDCDVRRVYFVARRDEAEQPMRRAHVVSQLIEAVA